MMLSSGNGVAPAIEAAGASEGGDYAAPPEEEGVGPDALSLMQALQALPKVSCNNCFLITQVQISVSLLMCESQLNCWSSCALVMPLYSCAQAHCMAFQNCGEAFLIPIWLMQEQRLPQISISCSCESSECL